MKRIFLFLFVSFNLFAIELVERNSVDVMELKKKYQTLMFNQNQLESILNIINNNNNNNNNNNRKYTFIDEENFYYHLKSIIYASPNNWTIFLNDKKINNFERRYDDKVTIVKITPNYVVFLWTGTIPEMNTMNYNNTIPLDKYTIDNENGEVKIPFKLSIHQTFLPLEYKIVEGFALPNTDVNDSPEEREEKFKKRIAETDTKDKKDELTMDDLFINK
jgi:hypothetical protein